MKQMKKSLWVALSGLSLAACSSGTNNGGSQSNTTTTQKQIFVSQVNQILTPVSAATNFNLHNTSNSQTATVKAASNSCIQLVEDNGQNYTTAISGNANWSTASVTFGLQNTCNSGQTFSSDVVLNDLLINGQVATSASVTTTQSGNPYMQTQIVGGTSPVVTVATPECSENCNWTELAPGAIVKITAQAALPELISSVTLSSVTLGGNAPAPVPAAPGNLQLTVDASQIVAACGSNCNNMQVNLVSPAAVIVGSESVNPAVNPIVKYNVENLAPGQYSVTVTNVPTLANGTINYAYQPNATVAISSSMTSSESVIFSFTPTAVTNSLKLSLGTVANAAMFESSTIVGRIINSSNSVVSTFQLGLNGSQTISSQALANGSYTVEVQGIGDPHQGIYYAPIVESVTITGPDTALSLNYANQLASNQLMPVSFAVQNPISGQSLSFGSDHKYYSYNTDSLESGTYYFPQNDNVNVSASSASGYVTSTSPTPLVISSQFTGQATIINSPVVGNNLMVGYLSNSYGIGNSIYTTVSQAAQAGYNTVVTAFAQLNNNAPMQFYGDQFLAYTSWQNFSACPSAISSMTNDIANAKTHYGLKYALVSVGGATNLLTLTPGVANPQIIAQNVVNFLQQYGLDGIDFDVEEQLDPQLFAEVLAAIKQLNPNVIITAAPQSNGTGNNNSLLVTNALNNNYNQAIAQGLFDYIWVQAYNTDGYTLSYNSQLCDETMACFIPAALQFYTSPLAVQAQGGIGVQVPSNTYFVVGEPATPAAAGTATVWHNTDYANAQAVYSALAQNYTTAMSMSQNGGAMTWSINQDIDEGCGFANAIAPVVSGISASTIVCPTNGTTYHGTFNPNAC